MKKMYKEIFVSCIYILVVAVVGMAFYMIDAERYGYFSGFLTLMFVIIFAGSALFRINLLITTPKKAERFARRAHKNAVDKAGRPYIEHVARVAGGVRGNDDMETAAWLHDIVEDTEVTLSWLEERGVSGSVLEAVKLLTRGKDIPYMEYISRLKKNEIARAVKIADLKDNMNLSRFEVPTGEDRERAEKYNAALKLLSDR